MTRFDKAVKVILQHEGGFVNNPNDPGGETKYGISKRAYPNEDIKNLTIDRATQIYFKDYWQPLNLYLINSDLLALHIFDVAVNSGVGTAVKMLQKVVGTVQDGALGKITAHAANCRANTVDEYIEARKDFYIKITKRNPKLKGFLKGWFNRIESTKI